MKKLKDLIHILFPIHTREIIIVILILAVLFIVQLLSGDRSEIVRNIQRPTFLNGDQELTLYYEDKSLDIYKQPISIQINKNELVQEEVDNYLEIVSNHISNKLVSQYNSYEDIRGPIDLDESYKDCNISYQVLPKRLLNQEGWIHYSLIDQEEEIKINYEIEFDNNYRHGSVLINIKSQNISKEYKQKYLENNIINEIQVINETYKGQEIQLPDHVVFYDMGQNNSFMYLAFVWLLIVLSCSLIAYYELSIRNKEVRNRKKIEITYLINAFILLYQTGMTIQKSFKVTIDNRLLSLDKSDFIYNDLLKIKGRIDSGQRFDVILSGFIEVFDSREAIRFNRLLLQTLKQGDDHLIEQLDYMTKIMWEERIRSARKESEKASSKLVFPMLLIFIVILIISIVPTFLEVKSIL